MSGPLLATLAGLALVDSTSIGTLVLPVWLLLAPGRVRASRFAAYVGTVAVFYFAVGLLLLLGAQAALAPVRDSWSGLRGSVGLALVQALVGGALLWWSFEMPKRAARRGGAPGRMSRWRDRVMSDSACPRELVGVALVATGLEVATMLPYLGAIGALTAARPGPVTLVVVLAAYCLVMVLPACVLLLVRVGLRDRVEPLLRRLASWLERNLTGTASWIVGIVGAWLGLNALGRLFA